jgi:hypothetical protein
MILIYAKRLTIDGKGKLSFDIDSIVDYLCKSVAGVTQLVECQLPKLNVASSNLVTRSEEKVLFLNGSAPFFVFGLSPEGVSTDWLERRFSRSG